MAYLNYVLHPEIHADQVACSLIRSNRLQQPNPAIPTNQCRRMTLFPLSNYRPSLIGLLAGRVNHYINRVGHNAVPIYFPLKKRLLHDMLYIVSWLKCSVIDHQINIFSYQRNQLLQRQLKFEVNFERSLQCSRLEFQLSISQVISS